MEGIRKNSPFIQEVKIAPILKYLSTKRFYYWILKQNACRSYEYKQKYVQLYFFEFIPQMWSST